MDNLLPLEHNPHAPKIDQTPWFMKENQLYVSHEGEIVSGSYTYGGNSLYTPVSKEEALKIFQTQEAHQAQIDEYMNCHSGEEIHVLGTGPSLKQYTPTKAITIAVNGAPAVFPNPTYWIMGDNFRSERPLYNWVREYLSQYSAQTGRFIRRGILNTQIDQFHYDQLFTKAEGPSGKLSQGLFYGLSIVTAAIDLARHMGAKRIVLFGVDYGDRSHAYSDVIKRDALDIPGMPWDRMELIEKEFATIYQACKSQGIEVINANPNSALCVIPRQAMTPPPASEHYNAVVNLLQKKVQETEAALHEAESLACGSSPNDGILIDLKQKVVEYREGGAMNVFPFDEIEKLKGGKNFLKIVAAMSPHLVPTKITTEG